MRYIGLAVFALVLAGCAPSVPDSGSGVGFGAYSDPNVRASNEPVVTGPLISTTAISDETVNPGSDVPTANGAVDERPAELPRPVNLNNPGISDEQDFEAVSSRETIESDAERRAAAQQAYQLIQPTALPERPGKSGVSIVQFALSTTNQVGQQVYKRIGVFSQARFDRNCAKYASSDLAQAAFLKAGGPERDRMGLDPDGDGFACFWDPTPFRLAVNN